jgi:hypothetical protein
MMNTRALWFLTLHLCLASVACSAADAGDDAAGSEDLGAVSEALKTPPLPSPILAVPAGNKLAFAYDAIGVQIYACAATATGYGWTLKAPDARLYNHHKPVIDHYVGPTWEWIKDGSKVQAVKLQGFTDDPSAIPELLLQATTHEGAGRMDDVTYIQRLETTGGLAPTTGCDADHVGATSNVEYTATYYFYRAQGGHCD